MCLNLKRIIDMIIETMGRRRTPITYTKSLFHFEGANNGTVITDERGTIWSVTLGVTTLTAQHKFGLSSVYTGNAHKGTISATNNSFIWGKGAFTIDFWIYSTTNSASYYILKQGDSSTTGISINIINSQILAIVNGNANYVAATINTNTWIHIAVVFNGGADGSRGFSVYKNGTLVSSKTVDYNVIDSTIIIGDSTANAYEYLDEMRISNIARWTSDFTPPTAPYTLD
jgi:hypothetical protein